VSCLACTVPLSAQVPGDTVYVCSAASAFLMIDSLPGEPPPGGSWTDPNGFPHSPVFIPSIDLSGTYCYAVNGDTTCLFIQTVPVPNAGMNSFIAICGEDMPELPEPDSSGYWVICGATTYCYVATGTYPCMNDTATMTYFLSDPPDAGLDDLITVCPNAPPFNMFDSIPGTPDPNGYWGASNGIFVPGSDTAGTYHYIVSGVQPCLADTSTLLVIVLAENAPSCLSTGLTANTFTDLHAALDRHTGMLMLRGCTFGTYALRIYDPLGRCAWHSSIDVHSDPQYVPSLAGLASGRYVLEVVDRSGSAHRTPFVIAY
jgi:hypothetical protein